MFSPLNLYMGRFYYSFLYFCRVCLYPLLQSALFCINILPVKRHWTVSVIQWAVGGQCAPLPSQWTVCFTSHSVDTVLHCSLSGHCAPLLLGGQCAPVGFGWVLWLAFTHEWPRRSIWVATLLASATAPGGRPGIIPVLTVWRNHCSSL